MYGILLKILDLKLYKNENKNFFIALLDFLL